MNRKPVDALAPSPLVPRIGTRSPDFIGIRNRRLSVVGTVGLATTPGDVKGLRWVAQKLRAPFARGSLGLTVAGTWLFVWLVGRRCLQGRDRRGSHETP